MPRVGRAWGTKSLHNVQSALVKDTAEHVASHTVLFTETGLVHAPQFVGTDSRALLPDLAHELDNKPLCHTSLTIHFDLRLRDNETSPSPFFLLD